MCSNFFFFIFILFYIYIYVPQMFLPCYLKIRSRFYVSNLCGMGIGETLMIRVTKY